MRPLRPLMGALLSATWLAACGGSGFDSSSVADRTRGEAEAAAGNEPAEYSCDSIGKDEDGQEIWECSGTGAGTTSAAGALCDVKQNGEVLETACRAD